MTQTAPLRMAISQNRFRPMNSEQEMTDHISLKFAYEQMDFDGCVGRELKDDMLRILKRRSSNKTEKIIQDYVFSNSCFKVHIVSFIFSICHTLKQSPDTRYLALELFNRYYLTSIIKNLEISDKPKSSTKLFHESVRVNKTFTLDIFVCILIASKFTESVEVVHNNTILAELSAMGEEYTLQDIVKDEKRILKQLNYEVFIPTVLTYIDLILAKLVVDKRLNKDQTHNNCCYIVDITYIHHNEIYQKFNFLITNEWEWSVKKRFQFQPIETNKVLLGSAIIYTAVMFGGQIPLEELDTILKQLEDITDVHGSDIKALSRIISEICIL